jgi:hypothetical protein
MKHFVRGLQGRRGQWKRHEHARKQMESLDLPHPGTRQLALHYRCSDWCVQPFEDNRLPLSPVLKR